MNRSAKISQKFKEADKVALAEKAENLTRWADAVDSDEYRHTSGSFHSGNAEKPRDENGRFTKGGGGMQKHRCVWGALADLRVQDGVGSWSYGGYTDGEAVGTNMPTKQLADFVGLSEGDVVADITRQYMAQHMPEYVSKGDDIPRAFVSYNDGHHSYGVLSKVMRDTAADIKRRLTEEEAVAS